MLPTASATARATDPFDALGDPHRRQILDLLRDGERSVGQIAEAMPISRPAVSRHLRLLKEAGLVRGRSVGVRHLYALDGIGAEEVRRFLESVWGEAATRYRIVAENTPGRRPHKSMIEPLRMSFEVDTPTDHAFETWTARDRSLVAGRPHPHGPIRPADRARGSGRWADLRADTATDEEWDWGRVTAWEPPARLVYLWHLERDRPRRPRSRSSSCRSRRDATRVEIEHRGWEALGSDGQAWRDANMGGWATLLPHYQAAVERGRSEEESA